MSEFVGAPGSAAALAPATPVAPAPKETSDSKPVAAAGATSGGSGAGTDGSAPDALAIGSGAKPVATSAAAPTLDNSARRTSNTVILESKVGQINGRPVLASQILEPLDGRLRAMAAQTKDPATWRREASRLIANQLVSRVRDELVLAEAQSNLTSEQRQGLLFFLGKLQENLVSAQGGSAVQADEALRASVGRSLQEEAQDQLDRELIEFELRSKVSPRVVVPYRQIRLEYDRQGEKFNPPPTARFRMIWVSDQDKEAAQNAESAIKTDGFESVAGSPANQFLRDKQGKIEVQLKDGDLAQTQVFSMSELDAAAHKLTPGQVSGPIAIKGHVAFIKYEALERARGVPLYEAQLEIEQSLRERRFATETARYFERLFDRGSFSDIESMTRLLLEIAVQRYLSKSA